MCEANPYAPPGVDTFEHRDRHHHGDVVRSAVPRVFGIMSIVFSSLFGLLLLMSMASMLPTTAKNSANDAAEAAEVDAVRITAAMRNGDEQYHKHTWLNVAGSGILLLLLAAGTPALLFIGVGQVRYRCWSAKATVIWGAVIVGGLSLTFILGGVATIVGAAQFASMLPAIPGLVALSIYPILLIVFFSKEHIVASMCARASGRP